MTLDELARRLGCRLEVPAGLEGDGAIEITRVTSLDDAGPGDLTFLSNPKYASHLAGTRASAVILDERTGAAPCPALRTANVYLTMARAVAALTPPRPSPPGISPLAAIDPTAVLGPDVSIAPFVVIGPGVVIGARTALHAHVVIERGARLGDDCLLHAHVSVRDGCDIGHRVVVQNGAVIGSDGFGFAPRGDGTHEKVPQVGGVVIEDDVEIGANSTIDRPAIGHTRIAAGTKIDNLVQIAHGVKIGRNALLAAQVGIAGSSVLGDGVVLAGQAGVAGHLHVGDHVVANAKTGFTNDVPAGAHVSGMPAHDVKEWRESQVIVKRLPDLRRLLLRLQQRVETLEARLGAKDES